LRSYEIIFTTLPAVINNSVSFFAVVFNVFESNLRENTKYSKLVNDEIARVLIAIVKQSENTNIDPNIINTIYARVLTHFSHNPDPIYLILASDIVNYVNVQDVVSRDTFMVNNLLFDITNLDFNNFEMLNGFLCLINSLLQKSFDTSFAYMYANVDFFDKVIDAIIAGLTTDQTNNELTLDILGCLINKTYEKRLYMFYQRYTLKIIENMIGIIVDKDQSYSFEKQCEVFAKIIHNISSNDMIRLNDAATNMNYVSGYMFNILSDAFRNLTKESIELFIIGLFSLCSVSKIMKEHVYDFKIKIYEYYSNEDLNDEIGLKKEREMMITK